jgi:hypothetical protein
MNTYLRELIRPWKLITLTLGLAVLIAGAYWFRFSDWDVGISLIMGVLTYLTAPWSFRVLLTRRYAYWPLAFLFAWFSVDGCYVAYHSWMGNEMLRRENALTSTPLYLFMGGIWMWQGTLAELLTAVRQALNRRN